MKIKKSKIVVPALGLLLLSTAASVSGSVAWFTANRTYKMTAGEFAVVNTKDNLEATLTAGIGTAADNNTNQITINPVNYVLTDASFDHTTGTTENCIIAPDLEGKNLGKVIPLSQAVAGATENATYGLLREDGTPDVYTAFTWDITFKLSFSSSASKNVGLFLDLSTGEGHGNSWAHEVYVAENGTTPVAGYYTDAACKIAATGTYLVEGTKYYKPAPDNTGRGFRIAFVPKAIPEDSLGVTKIWAPQRNDAREADEADAPLSFPATGNLKHIDLSKVNADPAIPAISVFSNASAYATGDLVRHEDKVYKAKADVVAGDWNAANWDLAEIGLGYKAAAFGDTTTSLEDGTYSSIEVTEAVMDKADTTGLPASATTSANAVKLSNCLGYFGVNPGSYTQLTYTCVAYYEGTDPRIINNTTTIYETMTASMEFGVYTLSD